MIKKTLLCFFAFLLALSVAAVSFAELETGNEQTDGIGTIIYYVPATRDTTEVLTARCVARAVASRWEDRPEILCGKYSSTKALQPAVKGDAMKTVFASGKDTGDGQLNKNNKPADYENKAYDVWFIVPGEATGNFINNTALMEDCRQLLVNESSLMHFVFISDASQDISPDSPLGALAAEGRADWIFVGTDFTAASPASAGDGALHTGSYFIAALYGRPLDLPAVTDDSATWSFELPESSKALVLADWNGSAGTATIKNAAGNEPQFSTLSLIEQNYTTRSGMMLEKVEAGTYTVSITNGTANSVRVYWYPDLSQIMPELRTEETWRRGENEITLSMKKIIGKPENYTVQFAYQDSEDKGSATTLFVEYNAEENCWVKKVSVGKDTEHVYVTPYIRLNMADGNRAWDWSEECRTIDVESEGISVRSSAPAEVTVYTDNANGAGGSIEYKWKSFFQYNAQDDAEFSFKTAEVEGKPGITCKEMNDGSGIRISAKPGEGLADSLTVTVSGTVNGETKQHEIVFSRRDVTALYDGIVFTFGEEVKAGEQVTVNAEIPEDIQADWKQACKQLPSLPDPETLLFICTPEGADSAEGIPLKGEILSAQTTLDIPVLTKPGKAVFNAEIKTEDMEKALVSKKIDINVRNEVPEFVSDKEIAKEVCLTGFPWAYQKVDNLLKVYLGTDTLFDLYQDREDNLTAVKVTIENIRGLELPEYGEVSGDTWTFEVANPDDTVIIAATEPGEHKIRVSASDGINESEPFEGTISVYSEVLRYVSFAVAGLAALLLLLIIILIIRYISKPSYENIYLRCYSSSDEDQEHCAELLEKTEPVPMAGFRKKGVLMSTMLILFRQPVLSKEYRAVADDIAVFPGKSNALVIRFGKEAMKTIGRHEKKEKVEQGANYRMRIGNIYILIENVRP